ncbi:hypothetical protein ABEB36_014300 [Hypothenemus hampei]|uniref:G-protein coupled receptors family 1 profile domain-containing protein n=1 Tax=Hypothenemus hampei TaxID=57062 RepID=A0ABD1E3Y2_HYPHA
MFSYSTKFRLLNLAGYEINIVNMPSSTPCIWRIKYRNQFILPIWRQVLWSILYAGMVIVATGGNLIVIYIVLAHKRMRTVTNYFLLNLSVADTMVSTLNVTFNFVYMLNSHWPFGELYCKISQFTSVLSICASVFSLMSISIDRIPFCFMCLTFRRLHETSLIYDYIIFCYVLYGRRLRSSFDDNKKSKVSSSKSADRFTLVGILCNMQNPFQYAQMLTVDWQSMYKPHFSRLLFLHYLYFVSTLAEKLPYASFGFSMNK